MSANEIPNKASFKIGEVAEFLSLEAYVLRYWETEFEQLKPRKTRSGQRAYSRADVELLVRIKALLYDDMYTIAGARKQLDQGARRPAESVGESLDAQKMMVELSGLRSRSRELETANQSLEALLEGHRARIDELERIDENLVFFPSTNATELETLKARVQELEEENSELRQNRGTRSQSHRHHLALVRKELETMSRLAAV